MELGDNIKYFRKINNLNQKDFAEKIETAQQSVSE